MRHLIIILISTLLVWGSEYISIQPSNLVGSYDAKTNGVFVYEYTVKLNYDAKNPLSITSPNFNPDHWYVPNGWHKLKAYYPPGTGLANLQFIAKTNSSYRIHLTFKADETGTVNHYSPISAENQLNTKNTTQFLATNGKVIELDTAMINNSNGGWLYIDIVEDAYNFGSYYGDVNPNILITCATVISDISKYAAWRSSVDLLSNGSPGDAVGNMTIIDKPQATSSTTRTIQMDLAIDPNIDKDGDGYSPNQGDCNDYSANVYPGANEIANDGIDQNCNGTDLVDLTIKDQDRDGYTPAQGDCDDYNTLINPGRPAIPNNGINDNCAQAPVYEFKSLHPGDLLTDLSNKFKVSSTVTISNNVQVSAVLSGDSQNWYGNNWQHYKFFIPKGIDSAKVVASSQTSGADFRVHAAFKANHNSTIAHAMPIRVAGVIADRETYEAVSNSGYAELVYSPEMVNTEEGGYVYIGIANNPQATSAASVNMQLIMTMNNKSVFDQWKLGVNVLHDDFPTDGEPEDDVGMMYIMDRTSSDQIASRSVYMATSTLPWSLYTSTPTASSSSSAMSSAGSSSSSCFWWEPGCGSGTTSSYSSSSTAPYYPPTQSSVASSSATCFFWEPNCSNGSNSSGVSISSSSFSSSSSSGAIDVSIDNSIVKDNLSGKEFQLIGVFSEYDFDRDGKIDPFDWLYKDSVGFAKLRGNEPTVNNVFGWKDIIFEGELVANWYLFPLGVDVDGDGSTKFDWIIISADSQSKQVYKLSGVTEKGTFKYSDVIDIDYSFSASRDSITFINLRPGE